MPRNPEGYSSGYQEDHESRYDPHNLKNLSSIDVIQACWERENQPATRWAELEEKPIWKLHWADQHQDCQVDRKTQDDRGRAMLFTSDIARNAQDEINKMDGTRTSEPMLEFIRQRPHDWEEIIPSLHQAAQDKLNLGQHLSYLAILRERPEDLDVARAIMEHSHNQLREILEEGAFLHGDMLPPNPGTSSDRLEEAVMERHDYIRQQASLAGEERSGQAGDAAEFIAMAVTARDMEHLYEQTGQACRDDLRNHTIHNPSPTALRAIHEISLRAFMYDEYGIGQKIQESLCEHRYEDAQEYHNEANRLAYLIQQAGSGQ